MSKTNTKGMIEYANEIFADVSGYEDYELCGKPHNIIRNPDMPKVIFKVLWENLKAGNNFHAVVKNLARSGRYYWVITDFDIDKDINGNPVKYFARRKAVPQEIIVNHIERLYKKLLQIEESAGVDFSEKYLEGFLEERGTTYQKLIIGLMEDFEYAQNGKKKGFLSRFFNR